MNAFVTQTTSVTYPVCFSGYGRGQGFYGGGYYNDPVFPYGRHSDFYGNDFCNNPFVNRGASCRNHHGALKYYERGRMDAMRNHKQFKKNQELSRDVASGALIGTAAAIFMKEDPRKGAIYGAAGGLLLNILDKNM